MPPRPVRIGQPGLEIEVGRAGAEGLLIALGRGLEAGPGIVVSAERVEDAAGAEAGLEQVGLEHRVAGRLLEELVVKGQGRLQQVEPQGLEAGDVEQLALADLGERVVDGAAGAGEAGLGPLALGLGFPGASLGLSLGFLCQVALIDLVPTG